MLPKKNPTAQGKGLPRDSASAAATTLPPCSTLGLMGRTQAYAPQGYQLCCSWAEPSLHNCDGAGLAEVPQAAKSNMEPATKVIAFSF